MECAISDEETVASYAAIMDYYRVDLPDFDGWVGRMRRASGGLFPARFEMVSKIEAYHEAIADADGIICESLPVGEAELGRAPNLKIVQKFGTDTRNIDLDACKKRRVTVKLLRRRVNIAVAEHAIATLLAMAKKLTLLNHRIDEQSLRDAGFDPKMYDRRHAAASLRATTRCCRRRATALSPPPPALPQRPGRARTRSWPRRR